MRKILILSFLFISLSCNQVLEQASRAIGIDSSGGVSAPSVLAISPASYGVKGGVSVTITGANFKEGASVIIGGESCTSVTVVSETEITCLAPSHFASVVDVVVLNTNGVSGTLLEGFSYNSYLYVTNQTNPSLIYRMRIDSATGAITSLGSTPIPNGAYGIDIDPSNTWVYSASTSTGQISGFSINHATGDLTTIPGSPFAAGANVGAIAISKGSQCAVSTRFVNSATNVVTSFRINQTNGALTKVSDYNGGTYAGFLAIDPLNRFVFVSNYGSNNISAYTLNATSCTLAFVGNYPSGTAPDAISVHPNGKYLYTGNATSAYEGGTKGAITAMSINETTGALTLINTYFTSNSANGSGVEIDKTGNQIYVTARGGDAPGLGKVFGYNINISTGELVEFGNWATGDGPNDVRILGNGKFVFTANSGSDDVSVFHRDLATGNLTPATPGAYPIGDMPAIIGITF